MNSKLIFSISRSLLLARWKQTLVAAVGVSFSIAMFVTLLGFMNGLNDMLDGLIINRSPHIKLFNEIKPAERQPVELSGQFRSDYHFIHSVKPGNGRLQLHNLQELKQALRSDPEVLGIAPKVVSQVFFNIGIIELTGVVNGIEVAEESRLFAFSDYVTEGKYTDLIHVPNSIILGKTAAEKMLLKIGDMVQVSTVGGNLFPLKVVGFFQSGLADADKTQSYASIETVQKILGKPKNYITDLNIKLHDLNRAPALARQYAGLFNVDAEDIQTFNAQFETGSRVRSIISYAVGITLLIVAGFGIYNILNMMIYEKMDSIAILKASGFSGSDVRNIFQGIALSIGLAGGIAGLGIGFGISSLIDQIPFNTSALPTIKTYPVNYDAYYYIIGISFALITTYLAGFFPSRKASKIDPVIIIRGK